MVGTTRAASSCAGGRPARRRGSAPAHGGEGGGQVARRAAGEAGVHADRGVEVGVGRPHDGGRRAARREPGDVDARRVDRVVAHDLAGDAGDQRGLAPAALLVARVEPVPALLGVGGGRLRRVGDEEAVLLGERVHLGAGGEVVGRLGAAVQHDQQRRRLLPVAERARDVELVGAAAGLVAEGPGEELRAVRHRVGPALEEPLEEVAPSVRHLRRSRRGRGWTSIRRRLARLGLDRRARAELLGCCEGIQCCFPMMRAVPCRPGSVEL